MAKKVLIVDDDLTVIKIVQAHLKHRGLEVISAMNGFDGLKLAQEESPDLIILDVMLPKMNGFKVCRLMKFDRKFRHIPIIMLTSREKESQHDLGLSTGADEYVYKSEAQGRLIELVMKYLGVPAKT